VIFLCASTIGTAQVLLNSRSDANPRGLANGSDQVGRNLMDHVYGPGVAGVMNGPETYHRGRRPNGIYIPRYRNLEADDTGYHRGYGYQGMVMRQGWRPVADGEPGDGRGAEAARAHPGPWAVRLAGFGEMLPNPRTASRCMPARSMNGAFRSSPSTAPMARMTSSWAADAGGCQGDADRGGRHHHAESGKLHPPGLGIHEMGTARMGHDPKTSVLNGLTRRMTCPTCSSPMARP
jgi:choline dehydrogenase-like flavoprotein